MGGLFKNFGSEEGGKVGTALERAFRPLVKKGNPGEDGDFIEGVVLTAATPLLVTHNLGKIPAGFVVIERNAHATVKTNAKSDTTLTLEADSTVTVTLWVF